MKEIKLSNTYMYIHYQLQISLYRFDQCEINKKVCVYSFYRSFLRCYTIKKSINVLHLIFTIFNLTIKIKDTSTSNNVNFRVILVILIFKENVLNVSKNIELLL